MTYLLPKTQDDSGVETIAVGLTASQRHQLLVEWNDTQAEYPSNKCIHHLFEAQVKQTPDAVAVVYEDKHLTYSELNRRANQLANYLQEQGVGPEVLVGLCMERSIEMVVGLLGILKAGGAYVPICPVYPQERQAFMLSDSQAPVLLTQEMLVAGLPENKAHVVCLDRDWELISPKSEENPNSGAAANNLAYIIYTSGSTGKPKGVMIEHCSVLNLLTGLHQAIYGHYQNTQLRVTVNGPLAFDTSVKQVIQLLHGHTLYIVPEALRFDGIAMLSYLRRNKIDAFDCTPSQLRFLISAGLLEKSKPAPKVVLVGGEAIDGATWQELAQAKNITFYNVYGPTECTVDATLCAVGKANPKPVIGRPIANTQIYILDAELQPVSVGVSGEIYISGIGLSRGYLNRPELTKEKFIPNPFSHEPGARLYKTGDLARYLSDGNIECLGRIDDQVKIRGFRIELGEIETVLGQHPAVRETAIVGREDVPGDKRLVAYVVQNQEQATTISELRSFLKERLPDYMVPSAFVKLDALPLTPNGKVDRRALPAPDSTDTEMERTAVAAREPFDLLEVQLIQIWEQVLEVKPIGIKDNFFDLGGHSLLVMRLVDRINQVFGKNLPMLNLFETPTVEELANLLRQEQGTGNWRSLVPIQSNGSKPPFFCMHELSGSVVFGQRLTRYLPDQPLYGLQPVGLDGKQAPQTRIEDMAAHYIQEIKTIQPSGPYFLGGYSLGGLLAFEMAQQLHAQGEKVALLAMMDTRGSGWLQPLKGLDWVLFQVKKILRRGPKYIVERLKRRIKPKPDAVAVRLLEVANFLQLDSENSFDQIITRIMETSLKAKESYVPQVYSGRIDLFRASLERAPEGVRLDPKNGWDKFATEGVKIHNVPALHVNVFEEPQIQVLAEKLRVCLEQAQAVEET